MNKSMIAARFERAVSTYHHHSTVQREVATHLFDALWAHCPSPDRVLELGCGSGHLSRLLVGGLSARQTVLNDLSPAMEHCVDDIIGGGVTFVTGDAETTDFDGPFDLVASASTVQWFDNPKRFMQRMEAVVNQAGVVALSSFDRDNLYEVSSFTGLTLPYPPLETLFGKQWQLLYQHQSRVVLYFESPTHVLRHLRATGVNSLDPNPWSRQKFTRFCDHYNQNYNTVGGVSLTYTPTYLIARKK